jgi:hypothetical protein
MIDCGALAARVALCDDDDATTLIHPEHISYRFDLRELCQIDRSSNILHGTASSQNPLETTTP